MRTRRPSQAEAPQGWELGVSTVPGGRMSASGNSRTVGAGGTAEKELP